MNALLASPNVLTVSYELESGTTVTLFKSTPGDTTPRLAMQLPGSGAIDCGAVENADRFGPHGTAEEFAAWAENFRNNA